MQFCGGHSGQVPLTVLLGHSEQLLIKTVLFTTIVLLRQVGHNTGTVIFAVPLHCTVTFVEKHGVGGGGGGQVLLVVEF